MQLTELRPPWCDRFLAWAQSTLARGLPAEDEPVRLLWAMTLWTLDHGAAVFGKSGSCHPDAAQVLFYWVCDAASPLVILANVANVALTAAIILSDPIAMIRLMADNGTSGSPSSPRPYATIA